MATDMEFRRTDISHCCRSSSLRNMASARPLLCCLSSERAQKISARFILPDFHFSQWLTRDSCLQLRIAFQSNDWENVSRHDAPFLVDHGPGRLRTSILVEACWDAAKVRQCMAAQDGFLVGGKQAVIENSNQKSAHIRMVTTIHRWREIY